MVALQREIAQGHSVVMDGRDIGTKVLPSATLKVFLTASAEVRARRRYDELSCKGMHEPYEKVLEELIRRDEVDTHREASPLRKAEDAVEVDCSQMTLEEVVETVVSLARQAVEGKSVKTWLYDFLKPIVRAYYFLVRGIRATGTENVASPGGYILCSNHVSASDPFVLATCARRRLHFMAKAELFKHRIVGGFISAIGAFPIRRGESDLGAVRESIRLLNEGHVVGIFPQGHPQPRKRPHATGARRGAHRPARRRQGRARLHRRPLPPLP